jgi:pyridinium-3,5-bisthiocarboxylic acid mononucleotide nickel chelatase
MKIAYFDCFSGASGDMFLGALVDAGVSLEELGKELRKLPVGGFYLEARKVRRCGISATKVDVIIESGKKGGQKKARRWEDIRGIIGESPLGSRTKEKAEGIFKTLFSAEAKVHGEPLRKVHLHELAAVDCLADVFGTLIGLELLGIEKVYASPLNLGGGSVKTEHGILPVPAPATAEILRNVPVYSSGEPFELTTPTGAAIVKSLVSGFGEMPLLVPDRIGTGAGGREIEDRPNVLRVLIGEMRKASGGETVTVIETNIDDMSPQIYEHLVGRLLQEGALDVFMTQVIMKKMRPGVKLTVLSDRGKREYLISIILRETTSIGLRYYEASRKTMDREMRGVRTKYGEVRVKVSGFEGVDMKVTPEYEDCRKLAKKNGVPLLDVIEEAKRAAARLIKKHLS